MIKLKVIASLILNCVLVGLVVAALLSFVALASVEKLEFLLSAKGFEFFLSVFDFPIKCLTAAVTIAAIQLALGSMEAANLQTSLAHRFAMHERYAEYIKISGSHPIYGFPQFHNQLYHFKCYDVAKTFDSVINEISPVFIVTNELTNRVDKISQHYKKMQTRLLTADEKWLSDLIDLANDVRNLRESYLLLYSDTTARWTCKPTLDHDATLGKKYLPALANDSKTPGLVQFYFLPETIRRDLAHIFSALYYFEFLRTDLLHRLAQINSGLEELISAANGRKFYNYPIDEVWRDNHILAGWKIKISSF